MSRVMAGLGMTVGLMLLALWVGAILLVVRQPKAPARPTTTTAKCSISGTPKVMLSNGPGFQIMSVAATQPCRVWVVGQTIKGVNTAGIDLLRSDDSGNHFRRSSFGRIGDNPVSVTFAPDGSAWIVGGHYPGGLPTSMVLRSSNGGDRWQEMRLPAGAGPLQGISFSDEKIWLWGYGYGDGFRPGVSNPDCVVLVSSDGGETWSEKLRVRQMAGHQPFIGPVVASGPTVMILGREADKDMLWSSDDGGQTLKRVDLGWPVSHLSLLGAEFAYVASAQCTTPCNTNIFKLLETTDGGGTWSQVGTVGSGLLDLTFLSRDLGFAITFEMPMPTVALYQTTDGGHNWQRVSDLPFASGTEIGPLAPPGSSCQGPTHQPTCVDDTFRGFVVGPNGLILTYGSHTIQRLVLPQLGRYADPNDSAHIPRNNTAASEQAVPQLRPIPR